MWPFKSKTPPEDTEARLERLEKAMRSMEVDWTETYGKFRTLQMRVAKQVQRSERSPEAGDTQPEGENVVPSTLSPKARLIAAQVLARRANGGQ
jgi:hypothetical protein